VFGENEDVKISGKLIGKAGDVTVPQHSLSERTPSLRTLFVYLCSTLLRTLDQFGHKETGNQEALTKTVRTRPTLSTWRVDLKGSPWNFGEVTNHSLT
jgi:hypothetical protein